jgi:hypothetical protein
MRCAWVKIDLDRLSLRLRVSLGRPLSEWDVRLWLQGAGFTWASGSWYTSQGSLSALQPDEILARQNRETSDGVTFIDRDSSDPSGPHVL